MCFATGQQTEKRMGKVRYNPLKLYIYIYISISINVYIFGYIRVYIYICTCIYTNVDIHIYIHAYMYMYMDIYKYVSLPFGYIYTRTYTYIFGFIFFIYIFICIHTHTYIYMVVDLKVLVKSFNCEDRSCYVGNPRERFFFEFAKVTFFFAKVVSRKLDIIIITVCKGLPPTAAWGLAGEGHRRISVWFWFSSLPAGAFGQSLCPS